MGIALRVYPKPSDRLRPISRVTQWHPCRIDKPSHFSLLGEALNVPVLPSDLTDDLQLVLSATRGERGGDQAAIAREVIRWGALMLRKNNDYGSSVWERPVLAPECDPGTAIRVRMSDKLSRLQTLLSDVRQEVDESVDDTLRDFGAYCLLELARPGRVASPSGIDVLSEPDADQVTDRAASVHPSDESAWMKWHGGPSPVRADKFVRVRCANGTEKSGRVSYFGWFHTGDQADIIAYRLLKNEARSEPVHA